MQKIYGLITYLTCTIYFYGKIYFFWNLQLIFIFIQKSLERKLQILNFTIYLHYKKSRFFLLKVLVRKTPHMVFCPHVQLDQSAILDKSIWTRPFSLGLFHWVFFTMIFWLNHCDNNKFGHQLEIYLNYFITN